MMEGLGEITPEQAAEMLVRGYCHWHVAPSISETLYVDGNGSRRLQLPSLYVTALSDVAVAGVPVPATEFQWTGDGLLLAVSGVWPVGYRNVAVTLTHGHEPAEVGWIVRQIAERVTNAPDRAAVIASLSVGNRQVQYRPFAGATGLMASEREALEPYRLTSGMTT